jgi:glycosyltransferase involved in cell wall biosynthesis
MKIGIVATHSFPIPWKTHTGDVVILDLATSLMKFGHEVTIYAPEGTAAPSGCRLLPMPCAWGKYPPAAGECEYECYRNHVDELRKEDIVHDFSVSKTIARNRTLAGRAAISTPLGGTWRDMIRPMNIAVWSEAMRRRGMRGASDYEGTSFNEWNDDGQPPIHDARVVFGGVDCDLYDDPFKGAKKENFLLWMNRWHPAKGYMMAIDVARETGEEVVLSGEHPDNETYSFQANCAREAIAAAKGLSNVHFEFLPGDPEHHAKKREMYRRAKALLYTVQFHEPFGLAQAEALASYTPVIGTRFGSVPEVIEHEVTGFVVDNKVERVADAVSEIEKISPGSCRIEAVARFSRSVMALNYLNLYEEILGGKGWG